MLVSCRFGSANVGFGVAVQVALEVLFDFSFFFFFLEDFIFFSR